MDSKPRTASRPVAWLTILFIIRWNQVQWQVNTTSLVIANQIPVQAFTIQTVCARATSDSWRHVLAVGLQGYWLPDMKYRITPALWERVTYQWRPQMTLLNWNSFSPTASGSLSSSSRDVLGHRPEQRTCRAGCLAVCWSSGLRDRGTGWSGGGTRNEIMTKTFQMQRDKTGLRDLGVEKAWFLCFSPTI